MVAITRSFAMFWDRSAHFIRAYLSLSLSLPHLGRPSDWQLSIEIDNEWSNTANNTVAVTRELMWKSNINEEQRRTWMPKEKKWNSENETTNATKAHHQFQCYCHRKRIELIVKWYCNIKTTTMTIVCDTSANKCNRFFFRCVLFLLEFIAVVCVYRSVWTWESSGNNL